jgi:hypothetical protein
MITNVTVGQEIPKERWKTAAENVQKAAPYMAKLLVDLNGNDKEQGRQDAEDFMSDITLAVIALNAVAANPGMCRFIPIPGKGKL